MKGETAAAAELRIGSWAAFSDPRYLRYGNETADVSLRPRADLTSDDPTARSLVIAVMGDTFRLTAPMQYRTSSLVLTAIDNRRYVRPYGLATLLDSTATAADPLSFNARCAVNFVNATFAVVVFAQVPWHDAHNGENLRLLIDGALFTGQRSLGGHLILLEGFDRVQNPLWATLIVVITVVHALFDPHGVVDCHLLIVLVALPCAHTHVAKIGEGLWRLLAPIGFAEPLTPEGIVGSYMCVAVIIAALFAFGILKRGGVAQAPLYVSYWWYHVVAYAAVPASLCSWLLMTRAESPGLSFFGFLCILLFVVAIPAGLGKWVHVNRNAGRFHTYSWFRQLPWHHQIGFPRGFWLDEFTETCWSLVRDVDAGAITYVADPIAKAVVLTVVLGTAPNNGGDCAAVYLLAAIAFGCFFFVTVLHRMRRCVAVNMLDALVMFALLLAAVGGYEQALGAERDTPHTMLAGVSLACIFLLLRAGTAVWLYFAERSWKPKELILGGERNNGPAAAAK